MIYANRANKILESITKQQINTYLNYWKSLTPKTPEEHYKRWIFSFLSVHTSWKANIKAYNILKNREWEDSEKLLRFGLFSSGVGLTEMRTRALMEFKDKFWADPDYWSKQPQESWVMCRNRLQSDLYGLGYTKTAFALEMCFPADCRVVCLDTHILSIYGVSRQTTNYNYQLLENHWVNKCGQLGLHPVMARGIYWDNIIQKQPNPEYWAYVFR